MNLKTPLQKDKPLLCGLSCNLDSNLLQAAIPLFEKGEIDAIEWSFDSLYKFESIPDWFMDLIQAYSQKGRLIGHGVYYSMLSGKWSSGQENWLLELKKMAAIYCFDHVSEHFGFFTGENFHQGAPFPAPFTPSVLAIGQDRLKRLAGTCQCPVGIENLAFSFTKDDAKRHGDFLEELVGSVNGFIILDLHNLYCHLHNFKLDIDDIISHYPLDRVREIHISGGSWEIAHSDSTQRIRRDTHDHAVPQEVFELLLLILPLCPNLKYVLLEQLGRGLSTEKSQLLFQNDFKRMAVIAKSHKTIGNQDFRIEDLVFDEIPLEDGRLHQQQLELSRILENCIDLADAKRQLDASSLAHSEWMIENWGEDMLMTAVHISKKWKQGF